MTEGTKYHPLFEHLLFSGQGQICMTFADIEGLLQASLPPSARRREEWWSNSPSGHSQARAWLRANYRTSQIDLSGETVTFTLRGWPEGYVQPGFGILPGRMATGMSEPAQGRYEASEGRDHSETQAGDHPLFGRWAGKVTLDAGCDFTKPAFEHDPS